MERITKAEWLARGVISLVLLNGCVPVNSPSTSGKGEIIGKVYQPPYYGIVVGVRNDPYCHYVGGSLSQCNIPPQWMFDLRNCQNPDNPTTCTTHRVLVSQEDYNKYDFGTRVVVGGIK